MGYNVYTPQVGPSSSTPWAYLTQLAPDRAAAAYVSSREAAAEEKRRKREMELREQADARAAEAHDLQMRAERARLSEQEATAGLRYRQQVGAAGLEEVPPMAMLAPAEPDLPTALAPGGRPELGRTVPGVGAEQGPLTREPTLRLAPARQLRVTEPQFREAMPLDVRRREAAQAGLSPETWGKTLDIPPEIAAGLLPEERTRLLEQRMRPDYQWFGPQAQTSTLNARRAAWQAAGETRRRWLADYEEAIRDMPADLRGRWWGPEKLARYEQLKQQYERELNLITQGLTQLGTTMTVDPELAAQLDALQQSAMEPIALAPSESATGGELSPEDLRGLLGDMDIDSLIEAEVERALGDSAAASNYTGLLAPTRRP